MTGFMPSCLDKKYSAPVGILRKRKEESGAILILALLVMAFMLVIAMPFLFKLSAQYRITQKSFRSLAALNLAEAGVDRAIWELNHGDISTWDGDSNQRTLTIFSFEASGGNVIGDIEINVLNPGSSTPVVEATGKVIHLGSNTVDRTVRVNLEKGDPSLLECALFADNTILFSANTLFDSYDSRNGEYGGENIHQLGNIGTNATTDDCITIAGNTEIYGNIASGPGSDPALTMDIDPNANIYGQTYALSQFKDLPLLAPPAGLTYYQDYVVPSGSTATISDSGEYHDIRLKSSAKLIITGDVTIYVNHDFEMKVGSQLEIAEGASLTMYIGHKFTLETLTEVNNLTRDPSQLLLLGIEGFTANTDFKSNSQFWGTFYAPQSAMTFNSNHDFYGSIVCKSFVLNSGAGFHFDEALEELNLIEGTSSSYVVKSWQEKRGT